MPGNTSVPSLSPAASACNYSGFLSYAAGHICLENSFGGLASSRLCVRGDSEAAPRTAQDRSTGLFCGRSGAAGERYRATSAWIDTMGRDPVNITRLVKLNDQFEQAQAHSKSLHRGGQTAAWHESAFKSSGGPVKVPNGQTATNRATTSRATAEIMDELGAARTTVLMERKARLKILLESERMMYEEELNALGLAIEKHAF